MNMLFNKVLGENEKCAFLLIKKLKELFGQPNISGKYSIPEEFGEGFKENQVPFIELDYNGVAHWHILLIGITVTK